MQPYVQRFSGGDRFPAVDEQSITLDFVPDSEPLSEHLTAIVVETFKFGTNPQDPTLGLVVESATMHKLSVENRNGATVGIFNEDIQATIDGKSKSMIYPFVYLTEPSESLPTEINVKSLKQANLNTFGTALQETMSFLGLS